MPATMYFGRPWHTYMKFWMKDTWIIPIHRPLSAYWILCIACLCRRELRLFDSLGEQRPWRSDIHIHTYMCVYLMFFLSGHFQDVMELITRLMSIAKQTFLEVQIDNRPWTAHPLTVCSPWLQLSLL